MGKKKAKESTKWDSSKFPRAMNFRERQWFSHVPRNFKCLYDPGKHYIKVQKIDPRTITYELSICRTIEHQFLKLRQLTQLSKSEYQQRYIFTQLLLQCIGSHHDRIYEGVLFGSTVNGLGFRDSDVDLRLRPLMRIADNQFEPISFDDDMVDKTLRNIAYQTTRCCPAIGVYVPSSRCPVAKLNFLVQGRGNDTTEGLNFDVSLSSKNSLGSFNSNFLRFLCALEPKFHLMATFLRYWSKTQGLILAGYLSSYALVNMLIFFCQSIEPPLLPTVDDMRQMQVNKDRKSESEPDRRAISQVEWYCLLNLHREDYKPSRNRESLSVLLLKFFEFYLKFPYSTHIITIRPGRALQHEEFLKSHQFHPRFPIKQFVNIQDPFDLKHNLTSGMENAHFYRFMATIKSCYENLHHELIENFFRPSGSAAPLNRATRSAYPEARKQTSDKDSQTNDKGKPDPIIWGLNALFQELHGVEPHAQASR